MFCCLFSFCPETSYYCMVVSLRIFIISILLSSLLIFSWRNITNDSVKFSHRLHVSYILFFLHLNFWLFSKIKILLVFNCFSSTNPKKSSHTFRISELIFCLYIYFSTTLREQGLNLLSVFGSGCLSEPGTWQDLTTLEFSRLATRINIVLTWMAACRC